MNATTAASTKPFSLDETRPSALGQWVMQLMIGKVIPWFFGLLRTIAPTFRFPFTNTVIVTRFDDVQEICTRHNDFPVPYQHMVDHLSWVPTFLLAMKDTPEYRRTLKQVYALWRKEDLAFVRQIAKETSDGAMDKAGGRIDAIQDLMVPVTLAVIERYYGIPISAGDRQPFSDGAMYIAGYLFGPQTLTPKKIATAQRAIAGVWKVIDKAIVAAHANPLPETTIIGRCHAQKICDDAHLRSALMGMIVGYLPTNTNANGRVLDVVMNEPPALEPALAAGRDGDYDLMLRVMHEALRMNYILPGLWRTTSEPREIGIGTGSTRPIAAGRLIYISFMAAMMDPRRVTQPKVFDATRSPDVYMIYGYQFHWCVGAYISDAMMQEIFMAIMRRAPKQEGKLKMSGNFPWNLILTYKS
jgi:cytochrome P450